MPQISVAPGSTDVTIQLRLLDTSSVIGEGKTGVAYDAANLKVYYNRERGASTAITLASLAAVDSAHSDGGWKEIDAVYKKGEYRLDLPDAVCAAGSRFAVVTITGSGFAPVPLIIDLKNEGTVVDYATNKSPAEQLGVGVPTKNSANTIEFPMYDTNGDLKTGLTVTGTVGLDDAARDAVEGTITEISGGWYKFVGVAADWNGNRVSLSFSASGAKTTELTYATKVA